MKNKNRQDAAKKRVRDQNGKFQGGLLFRRPKILFLIEKVVVADNKHISTYSSTEQQCYSSPELPAPNAMFYQENDDS